MFINPWIGYWGNDWKIVPHLDIRERYERRTDRDFNSAVDDNRSDLFSRFRPGFDLSWKGKYTATVTYQYSHDLYWTSKSNASGERSDLLQGSIQGPLGHGTAMVGRVRFLEDDQRFVGPSDWGVTGYSWDGAHYAYGAFHFGVGRLAVAAAPDKNAKIAYADYKGQYGNTLVLYKDDSQAVGDINIVTVAQHWMHKFSGLNADVTLAGQTGHVAHTTELAWAGSAKLTHNFPSKFSAYVGGDIASGGNGGSQLSSFDQGYGTNHGRYGYSDLQGLTNMEELTVGVGYKATKKLSFDASYHRMGLYNGTDAWYNITGGANKSGATTFVDPTGKSGRDVGQELDLGAFWDVRKDLSCIVEVSQFYAGNFVKSFTAPNTKDQFWLGVQLEYHF